ncbi:MAG: hypothetical protein ACLP2Y_16470 [Limisphaerales bacterium]
MPPDEVEHSHHVSNRPLGSLVPAGFLNSKDILKDQLGSVRKGSTGLEIKSVTVVVPLAKLPTITS